MSKINLNRVKLSIDGFQKAYKVINSCNQLEQLDMARCYLEVFEKIIHPTMLPMCEVLRDLLSRKAIDLERMDVKPS